VTEEKAKSNGRIDIISHIDINKSEKDEKLQNRIQENERQSNAEKLRGSGVKTDKGTCTKCMIF